MTTAQLILVAVTSALVSVGAMLVVATVKRARAKDNPEVLEQEPAGETEEDEGPG